MSQSFQGINDGLDAIAQMLAEIEKEQQRAANLTLVNLQSALKAVTMKDLTVPQFDDSYLTQVFAAEDSESVKQFTNIREVITAQVGFHVQLNCFFFTIYFSLIVCWMLLKHQWIISQMIRLQLYRTAAWLDQKISPSNSHFRTKKLWSRF